jgi:hypothetical protein
VGKLNAEPNNCQTLRLVSKNFADKLGISLLKRFEVPNPSGVILNAMVGIKKSAAVVRGNEVRRIMIPGVTLTERAWTACGRSE